MTKWMLLRQTKTMAQLLGSRNIRVNAVCPGVTMFTTTKAVVPGVIVDQLVATSALKSSLEPEDMTGVVLFLASDEASKMTGQVLDQRRRRLDRQRVTATDVIDHVTLREWLSDALGAPLAHLKDDDLLPKVTRTARGESSPRSTGPIAAWCSRPRALRASSTRSTPAGVNRPRGRGAGRTGAPLPRWSRSIPARVPSAVRAS